jgi:hypothetical protein
MAALQEMARLVREELVTLIQPVQLLSVNPNQKTGAVTGRFRSNGLLFDYNIGKGRVRYKPVGASGSRSDAANMSTAQLVAELQLSRKALKSCWERRRLDGYRAVAGRLDAKNCNVGYSCGETCISRVRDCNVKTRGGIDKKLVKLMEMSGDPKDPKTPMLLGPDGKPVRITTANIKDYAGDADVSPIVGREAEGLAKAFQPNSGNTAVVPLDKLIVTKDELKDPKFLAGKKADPRETAAKAMGWGIDGDPRNTKGPREPLSVSDNGDGTFTVVDGNATAQAAMLAGWSRIPVRVVAYQGESLDLQPDKPPGARHSDLARSLSAGVRKNAEAQVESVTKMVVGLATRHGADMEGVSWRLKPTDSIASKIDRDVAELMKKEGLSEQAAARQAASTMGDAMRYTMVIGDGYTSKLKKVVNDLETSGHTLRVKNSWEEGQAFRGVNIAAVGKQGERFELQFHTSGSKKAAQRMHSLYNVYRESKDDSIRRKIYDQMVRFGEQAGSPYEKSGPDGPSVNLRERQELLGIGKRVFRGYQTTAEAFPGQVSRSERRRTGRK